MDILFGTVPASVDFQALEEVAQAATPLCALYYAGRDRELHYFLLVCHTSGQAQCLEALREYGFSRASLRGWTGTAADNDRALDEEIARVEQDLARLRQSLADRGAQREGLQRSLDRCTQEIAGRRPKPGCWTPGTPSVCWRGGSRRRTPRSWSRCWAPSPVPGSWPTPPRRSTRRCRCG